MAKPRLKDVLSTKTSRDRLRKAAAHIGYSTEYNPPKVTPKERREFSLQCRELVPLAMERLTQIVLTGSDSDALKAIEQVLNRGYGRAPQTVDVTVGLEGESLQQVARAILKRRATEALPGGYDRESVHLGVNKGSPSLLLSDNPNDSNTTLVVDGNLDDTD